jgi:prephenate dehydratase
LTVAFQGERGAYSEAAIRLHFAEDVASPLACKGFRDVFEAVLTGRAAAGVVPIENSLAGSVHENYDLLLQYPDIDIVGEQKIRIEHSLIGFPGADIETLKRVYSHPQGLAQCAQFLDQYAHLERVPFYDTAGSVAHIAREGMRDCAAIASLEAARVYGLVALKEGIETNPRNYTRFFVIASQGLGPVRNPNMASLVFSTPDRPGALFHCLEVLAAASLNMTKLESRPILGKPWEYMFYIDVQVPENLDKFHGAIEKLRDETEDLRVLGMYRS